MTPAERPTDIDCVRPPNHNGRCRDSRGCTWENNHRPGIQTEPVAAQPDLFGDTQWT